jgi:hypothetical protein
MHYRFNETLVFLAGMNIGSLHALPLLIWQLQATICFLVFVNEALFLFSESSKKQISTQDFVWGLVLSAGLFISNVRR